MNTKELARAARRVIEDRLGRLRGSMQELGEWFRENVAQLIGKHAGDAVRDALAAALGRASRDERHARHGGYDGHAAYGGRGDHGGHGGYDPYALHEDEWGDENGDGGGGDFWGGREATAKPRHEPAGPRSRRWDGVLAAVAQVGCWWLRQGLPRASLLRVVALGAAAALAAVLVSPIVGGIIATAGTALLAAAPPPDELKDKNNR